MGWFTTKDGRKINSDWFTDEEGQKIKQWMDEKAANQGKISGTNIKYEKSNGAEYINSMSGPDDVDKAKQAGFEAIDAGTGKSVNGSNEQLYKKFEKGSVNFKRASKDEKEKQIEANKKEADRKNAEEKQKDSDKNSVKVKLNEPKKFSTTNATLDLGERYGKMQLKASNMGEGRMQIMVNMPGGGRLTTGNCKTFAEAKAKIPLLVERYMHNKDKYKNLSSSQLRDLMNGL